MTKHSKLIKEACSFNNKVYIMKDKYKIIDANNKSIDLFKQCQKDTLV
jgi:hypothetical protein